MDITIKCPKCDNEFTASDITDTAPCNKCGASVNTKENKKNRFSLKKKDAPEEPESAPVDKKSESTPDASDPSSNPADVIRKLQGQHANRTVMPANQPPAGGERDAEASDFSSEDIEKMEKRKRRKIIAGRVVGVIIGLIFPGAVINGMIYYADNYNEALNEWILFPSIIMAVLWAIGLCVSTMMSSFREFFIAACFPIVGVAGVMVKPIVGLGMFALSILYTTYFIITQTKSFFFKGYFFGVLFALVGVVFQKPEASILVEYFEPAIQEAKDLLSK